MSSLTDEPTLTDHALPRTRVAPIPPRDDLSMERVGSYQLVRRIGAGGMAEVWLGKHAVSGELGAVKRLSPLVGRPELVARYFSREGRAIARLAHPHIVSLFEYGEGYVVTAFVDGMSLARRMQSPLDPVAALRIIGQIAAALAHAHRRGIVHRDVKPANILLDRNGDAFLADFGVAALGDEHRGEIVGTPHFMAPEQRAGLEAGPAADQYALGRTLLELLCGGPVPVDRVEALAALPAHLPTELRAILDRATHADPERRFATVEALAEALAGIDLAAHSATVRVADARRPTWAFEWLAGAHRRESLGAELMRADYRLSDLVTRGFIDAAAAAAVLAETGLADIGFSIWGATTRLGPITDPLALARASELVVLLHGLNSDREDWRFIAPVLCRGSSLTLALAPDVHGFGESPFAAPPTEEQGTMQAIARAALGLCKLLGVKEVPSVLIGHSMSAIGLLGLEDRDYPANVARVALNPILVSHDPTIRPRIRSFARVVAMCTRAPWLLDQTMRVLARVDVTVRDLLPEEITRMLAVSRKVPPAVLARILTAFADAPLKIGRQERVAVVASAGDNWMRDPEALLRAVEDLGLARAQIEQMPSGGHFPHLESVRHPEWTARNIGQLVRVIQSMLLTAHAPRDASGSPDRVELTATSRF